MSKTQYILSLDTLKTMGQGALGAMTFGMFHQFTTNKIIEINNEKIRLEQEQMRNEHNRQINNYQTQIDKLTEKVKKLEERKGWFW